MAKRLPERALIKNQKDFTVEVSEKKAKAIQKELNKHVRFYTCRDEEILTAEQFVREYLIDEADNLACDTDPYNY